MTTDTTTPDAAAGAAATPSLGRLATWRYVLNTANLPAGMTKPDAISKWLVITRAAVFSMTARRASGPCRSSSASRAPGWSHGR